MTLPLGEGSGPVARQLPPGALDLPVDDLPLSTRARNCLRRAGIATIGELVGWTPEGLLRIAGFGTGCLAEVTSLLRERGLALASAPVEAPSSGLVAIAGTRGSRRARPPEPAVIDDTALEQAFEHLLAWAGVPPSRRPALAARLGWPDGNRRTLQEAGDMVGVTRERVRQIERRFEERSRGRAQLPVLERALAAVAQQVPTTAEKVTRVLLDEGLSRGPVHPAALVEVARILGIEPGFEAVSIPGLGEVVVSTGTAGRVEQLRRAGARLKQAARPYGFMHIDLARSVLPEPLDDPAIVELALRMVGAEPLDAGWFFVKTDSRQPAIRLMEDMLAVAGGALKASELREGFERRLRWRGAVGHHDQEGWYPSAEALLAFCLARPDRFRVDGDVITSRVRLDLTERLVGAERTMVEVLLEAPGRVLRREDFEREVLARGVNANTFGVYSSYSPFLRDLGGGLWAVRGVEPDPVEVERLRRRRPPRRKQVEGWVWLPSGALRVSVKLARTSSLVVGLPSAVRPYLSGRSFAIVLPGGERKGKVRVDDEGTSWGYGPALARLGAELGDLMLADFDLATGTVTLSLVHHPEEEVASDG